jgi:hypothetical protein
MVSVVQKVIRRVEAGMWIEDRIKEGYTKGSWEHVLQSDKVLIKAWNPKTTRAK